MSYSTLLVAGLKEKLSERNLPTTGKKQELIQRLEEDDAQKQQQSPQNGKKDQESSHITSDNKHSNNEDSIQGPSQNSAESQRSSPRKGKAASPSKNEQKSSPSDKAQIVQSTETAPKKRVETSSDKVEDTSISPEKAMDIDMETSDTKDAVNIMQSRNEAANSTDLTSHVSPKKRKNEEISKSNRRDSPTKTIKLDQPEPIANTTDKIDSIDSQLSAPSAIKPPPAPPRRNAVQIEDSKIISNDTKSSAARIASRPINDMVQNENSKSKNKKKKKKRQPPFKRQLLPSEQNDAVEYIPEAKIDFSVNEDYAEFQGIFDRFEQNASGARGEDEELHVDVSHDMDVDQTKLTEEDEDEVEIKDSDEESDEEEKDQISKKKLKKMNRLSVAELKLLVKKPEIVEWVDVTAADPSLLLHLKSYKNTVPVPAHWSQKRKFLQNKRGIEKPPFELPSFIKDTGIMELRSTVTNKDADSSLAQKARAKINPKMGKIDIDYQKLHDAFFLYQTKPVLTTHGDMYFEGKEFEVKMKFNRPGYLSEELREALGMPVGTPPPWLINMQRYGPPPSYPALKIPGLNAPIPYGAQWGYQPGGWGRPPVDEHGNPLYGDVFAANAQPEFISNFTVDHTLWGELEPELPRVAEEEEEEAETDAMITLQDGIATPSGIESSVSHIVSGSETPAILELRKDVSSERIPEDDTPKVLYKVLDQKETNITGLMGSQHTYDMSGGAAAGTKRKNKYATDGVDVALNPEDVSNLDVEVLQRKYNEQTKANKAQLGHEDFSDMVAEHANKQGKKRKVEDPNAIKKKKDFKF